MKTVTFVTVTFPLGDLKAKSVFERVYVAGKPSFIFETIHESGKVDPISVIGVNPIETLRVNEDKFIIQSEQGVERVVGNPLLKLKEYLQSFEKKAGHYLGSPAVGVFGYLGYDSIRYLETIPLPARGSSLDDDACVFIFRNYFVINSVANTICLATLILSKGDKSVSKAEIQKA